MSTRAEIVIEGLHYDVLVCNRSATSDSDYNSGGWITVKKNSGLYPNVELDEDEFIEAILDYLKLHNKIPKEWGKK